MQHLKQIDKERRQQAAGFELIISDRWHSHSVVATRSEKSNLDCFVFEYFQQKKAVFVLAIRVYRLQVALLLLVR